MRLALDSAGTVFPLSHQRNASCCSVVLAVESSVFRATSDEFAGLLYLLAGSLW